MKSANEHLVNRDTLGSLQPAPPVAQIIALGDVPSAGNENAGPLLAEAANPLHNVQTQLQVCVGKATVTVGELLAARESQVLVLDRTVEQAVDLLLQGKVIARGQLVAVDGHFAVRITELPLPLTLQP
jgi:flagellar motor switch protein FliN/FliY